MGLSTFKKRHKQKKKHRLNSNIIHASTIARTLFSFFFPVHVTVLNVHPFSLVLLLLPFNFSNMSFSTLLQLSVTCFSIDLLCSCGSSDFFLHSLDLSDQDVSSFCVFFSTFHTTFGSSTQTSLGQTSLVFIYIFPQSFVFNPPFSKGHVCQSA